MNKIPGIAASVNKINFDTKITKTANKILDAANFVKWTDQNNSNKKHNLKYLSGKNFFSDGDF